MDMNSAAATTVASAVHAALTAREQAASVDVFFPFVRLSRNVASPDGCIGTIKTTFRFDGDLVLIRGLGRAADDLAAKVSQARHEGLAVL